MLARSLYGGDFGGFSWNTVEHNISAFCPLCYQIARETANTLLNTHTPQSIRAAVTVSVGLNNQYDQPLMLTIGADCTHA